MTDIRILSSGATAEDIAAVTAVLTVHLEQLAEEAAATNETPTTSAWERSARGLRAPLSTGPGAWRSFG